VVKDQSAGDRLEVLSREECLALLASRQVGRLGVSIEALPAILPVNFRLRDGRIIVRTVPGTKLDAAVGQAVVAFEVDDYDPEGRWGWSVLVRGVGSEISQPDEMEAVKALPLRAWAFKDGTADRYMAVDTTLVSGRRFGSLPGRPTEPPSTAEVD
jgi:nitroimidazol reductase NimA-like FMN-containing flavoprotein (pyridoxamine 5'-phosphate oxidase superfamily)